MKKLLVTLGILSFLAMSFAGVVVAKTKPNTKPIFGISVQSEPIPNQVRIVNTIPDDQGMVDVGTGYFAWVGGNVGLVTAQHVLKSDNIKLQGNKLRILNSYIRKCVESEYWGDGSCLIFQDTLTSTNIIRDTSYVPDEVSIYSNTLKVWMPFRVVKTFPEGFVIEGADTLSYACRGDSGSPVVESHNGIPSLDINGNLISRGELSVGLGAVNCSSSIFVLNLDLNTH